MLRIEYDFTEVLRLRRLSLTHSPQMWRHSNMFSIAFSSAHAPENTRRNSGPEEPLQQPELALVRRQHGHALRVHPARPHEEAEEPGRSVRGERANFTRLVLGWLVGIEAKFCK